MAVPPPLNTELVFSFPLTLIAAQVEVAEFTIWLQADAEPDDWDDAIVIWAQSAADAWSDGVSASAFCNNVHLEQVYARHYGPDGKLANEQSAVPNNPWVGTASPPALPWETSLAVSTYTYEPGTFTPHGRRKRGRYYQPPMAASALDHSNSGYHDDTSMAAVLTEQVGFLRLLGTNDFGVQQAVPCVFSRMDGVLRPITWLAIDAKFDSQRRREHSEPAGRLREEL